MNIVVCLKQVLDPDVPARDFKIDSAKREAHRGSANLVTSIFCANALETALQYRDSFGGKITALSFGTSAAEEILRKAIALKADEAVLVENPGALHPDPLSVARVLAGAIKKLGGADLVLVGRESADWGAGQTGGLLAEELGLPSLSFVDRIEKHEDAIRVRRQTETGRDFFHVVPPAVLTITNDDQNVPRVPKTKDVMLSSRKPITKWKPEEVGVSTVDAGYSEVVELFIPEKQTECEFVAGDSVDEKVQAFARKILDAVSGG